MPTFSAVAFDRCIESSITKSTSGEGKSNPSAGRKAVPPRAFLSPTLYPTPQTTPLPYSPSSFTFSPYVINHKRRGPPRPSVQSTELKDGPQQNGCTVANKLGEGSETKWGDTEINGEIGVKDEQGTIAETVKSTRDNRILTGKDKLGEDNKQNKTGETDGALREIDANYSQQDGEIPVVEEVALKVHSTPREYSTPRETITESVSQDVQNEIRSNRIKKLPIAGWNKLMHSEQNEHYEHNVFVDDSCWKSLNGGSEAAELFQRSPPGDVDCTPRTNRSEFYDAEDDLSIEDAVLQHEENSNSRIHYELDALRSKISVEIERSTRAEAALSLWQAQWQDIVEKFSSVGLSLPSMGIGSAPASEKTGLIDYIDLVCGELTVARLVADAVGRGLARAELDQEMEKLIDGKNHEISRLRDKLRYYELINHEMSQRNQEAIEIARRRRRAQKKRQRWIWSSLAMSVAIGSIALAYSYLPWSGMKDWMPLMCVQSDSEGTVSDNQRSVPDNVEV